MLESAGGIGSFHPQGLLAAASLLQVLGVRAACCVFLRAALAPDNALGIRAFAELHAAAELARAAHEYVAAHFAQVLHAEEFLALEPDTLAQLLDSDRIMVTRCQVRVRVRARARARFTNTSSSSAGP